MDWIVRWGGVGCMLCGLLACGPGDSTPENGAGGGSEDGAAESTGSEASDAGSSGAADGTTTGESGSDTTEDVCMVLDDDITPAEPTLVEITNGRAEPIFIGPSGGCTVRPFELTRLSDQAEIVWHSTCRLACDLLLTNECESCDGCDSANTTRIDPGATLTIEWNGLHGVTLEAPPECVEGLCASSCEKRVELEPGAYELSVHFAEECPSPDVFCSCSGGASSCNIGFEDPIPATSTTSIEVDLPASSVAITIE